MKRYILILIFCSLTAALYAVPPEITSLSTESIPRSGRLVIRGSNFGSGSDDSRVEIGGLPAPFTRWTDTRIVAYVPEDIPIGPATVQVLVSEESSNLAPLEVTARPAAQGRIRWQFQADADYFLSRPVIGSDGTVYANDISGHLYALATDGGLKWILRDAGNAGITVGPDDTIYVGSTRAVTAVNPDGTLRWRFAQSPAAFYLLGPNLGPDGNLYVVATEGLGVFSLTPESELRWNVPERYDRPIVAYQDIVFGSNGGQWQLYFQANAAFVGISLDGNTRFRVPAGLSLALGDPQPVVGPVGDIYMNVGGAMGLRLAAFDPNGSRRWTFFPVGTNVVTAPDVGPDGAIYDGQNLRNLYAINPDGSERWRYVDDGILFAPNAGPNNDLIFMSGLITYGQPGFFAAVSTAGTLLWKIPLPSENGGHVVPFTRAQFSADGTIAYVGTAIPGQDRANEYCYLYAVQTATEGTPQE